MRSITALTSCFAFPLLLLSPEACTNSNGPSEGSLTLKTDRAAYIATFKGGEGSYRQYGFDLIARFENKGDTSVFLARCYPDSPSPTFDITARGKGVESAYNGVWACVGHDKQIEVKAGEVRTDTLHIVGPTEVEATGKPLGTLTGEMRLGYSVQGCQGDGECRINGAGLSNFFIVAVAE